MKKLLSAVAIGLLLILSGCSANLMVASPDAALSSDGDYATIVFMRSSFVLSAVGAELYEIENGELSLVGGLANATKIYHKTKPGKKVYMAHGNAADFMLANVEAGKTYYALVRPNWGTSGFIPTPVRTDGTTDYNTNAEGFKNWFESTKLMEKNPSAQEWFEKNKAKVQKVYDAYWKKFIQKTEAQKQERTLNPSDGV